MICTKGILEYLLDVCKFFGEVGEITDSSPYYPCDIMINCKHAHTRLWVEIRKILSTLSCFYVFYPRLRIYHDWSNGSLGCGEFDIISLSAGGRRGPKLKLNEEQNETIKIKEVDSTKTKNAKNKKAESKKIES